MPRKTSKATHTRLSTFRNQWRIVETTPDDGSKCGSLDSDSDADGASITAPRVRKSSRIGQQTREFPRMETPLAAYNYSRAACYSEITCYCLTLIFASASMAVISAE